MSETEDKLKTLLADIQKMRERMRVSHAAQDVIDHIHELSHEESVTLYNAVVQRLMVTS